MSEFSQVVKERRSAVKFIPNIELPQQELEDIFSLVKYAPSAFNLQHTHYVVVQDKQVKEKVYDAAYKQYKIQSASAVVLVFGHMDAYRNVSTINEGLLHLNVISKQEYDQEVESVTSFYESRGDVFMREEAIRNASLSAQLFMLAAKEKGWDTCPMIGFDPAVVQDIVQVPDRYVPVMLIAIGKEDTARQRPRGYRKPVGEFVSYNRFL